MERRVGGVGLGQLLLALDATMVRLLTAPRGLDVPVASAALLDSDDLRLGLAPAADAADMFFLLGVSTADTLHWLNRLSAGRAPRAIFVKQPDAEVVARAGATGVAVVAVDPEARWERLYLLVNHVLSHHGDRSDPLYDSSTDLFGLAQAVAERTRGMVSIEDAQSHVLAYSASDEDADELRRLSILGRAGPPEHLEWLRQWGIFDALRSTSEAVAVAARPELGLRPRLAIGIHAGADERHPATFAGSIWVQQGRSPLANDAAEILSGAAVLAARIMARLAARPSLHTLRVHQLLGLAEDGPPAAPAVRLARDLGIDADARAAVVGLESAAAHPGLADVVALSASAFSRDAQVAGTGSRIYLLLPAAASTASVTSWLRGVVAALRTELGVELRAVLAAPVAGLAEAAAARAEIDRVLDSADRHPGSFGSVTSLAEARTAVALDEIVTLVADDPRLLDPRVRELDEQAAATLRSYLDSFGDVAAAAQRLNVHPNTVRYRVRRIEQTLGVHLDDPDVRLLLALSLRALA